MPMRLICVNMFNLMTPCSKTMIALPSKKITTSFATKHNHHHNKTCFQKTSLELPMQAPSGLEIMNDFKLVFLIVWY